MSSTDAYTAHPGWMVVQVPHGSTAIMRWAIRLAALTYPSPDGWRRCPPWWVGDLTRFKDTWQTAPRTYRLQPDAWPAIVRAFATWRLPPPTILREASERAA